MYMYVYMSIYMYIIYNIHMYIHVLSAIDPHSPQLLYVHDRAPLLFFVLQLQLQSALLSAASNNPAPLIAGESSVLLKVCLHHRT